MKIAIDIHGVVSKMPEFFAELTRLFINAGHEVHILTGSRITKEFIDRIKKYGIVYTHLFSIVEYHMNIGTEIFWEDENNPWIDDEVWNKTKADYCRKHNIDMCWDDEFSYNKHFTTPFAWLDAHRPNADGYVKRIDPRKLQNFEKEKNKEFLKSENKILIK